MSEHIPVGYIGLGNIGAPCAQRLITGGFNTHVYDVFAEAVAPLVASGATAMASPGELAAACGHIGICVRDDAQVEALLYGDEGIFAHAASGTLVAIHSTVTQSNLLRWHEEAKPLGIDLIDAPITGGAHRAADGTLCYMVGGTEAQVAAGTPVFETSGEKVVHAGPVGSGIALKLCNNFIQYTEFVAMVEAARLASASGLSLDVLREVGLSNGVVNEQMFMFASGRNAMALSDNKDMEEYFSVMGKLGEKDLDCALETAAERGVVMPTAQFVRERLLDVFLGRDESRPPSE